MKAKIALEESRLANTDLRAPVAGMIVTPRIEERVGQFMTKGAEFCVVMEIVSGALLRNPSLTTSCPT